jgi:hypothetical protein
MLASFSTFKDMCIPREDYEGSNSQNDSDRNQIILKKTIN